MRTALLIIAALVLLQPVFGETNNPADVSSLIRGLGAQDYAMRNHAEEQLMSCSRVILPALEGNLGADDPEVRERVKRIIHHLKWSPSKIPCSAWIFDHGSERLWYASSAEWRKSAIVTVEHLYKKEKSPLVANCESVAQSFVPMTTNIAAVELELYPLGEYDEWFRVEVRADREARPGPYVLSRAWIRADKAFPTGQITLFPFDIPDVAVDSNKTYWIVFTGVRGPASRAANPFPIMFSGQDSSNRGQSLVLSGGQVEARGDMLHFRVLSSCVKVPLLRPASETERKAIPDTTPLDARWAGEK